MSGVSCVWGAPTIAGCWQPQTEAWRNRRVFLSNKPAGLFRNLAQGRWLGHNDALTPAHWCPPMFNKRLKQELSALREELPAFNK